ncbi:MAG: FecR family protein, partial [Planctomyces sp.]
SWAEGDRIGDVVVRLFGGRLELTFDDGAKVVVEAPSEFRPLTTGQLQLRRGRMTASVPEDAIGFTVSTPTSQVVDLGTEFEITVKETGSSDVLISKGEIEIMPAVANDATPRKWRLVPNGFHKATFFERMNATETSPV